MCKVGRYWAVDGKVAGVNRTVGTIPVDRPTIRPIDTPLRMVGVKRFIVWSVTRVACIYDEKCWCSAPSPLVCRLAPLDEERKQRARVSGREKGHTKAYTERR